MFDCYNGEASGELHSFMGFLSGLTELVGIYTFINVAKKEIWPKFRNVLIVSKCYTFIVRLLRYFAIVIIAH